MQDNTAAVEGENPSFSAKKLLNHWLRFSSGLPETNITLNSEFERILLDYSWQRATPETLEIGRGGAGPFAASLKEKINRMFGGEHEHLESNEGDPEECHCCWYKLWVVFTGLITFCRSKGYRNSKGKATAFPIFRDYVRCILCKYLVLVLVVGLANVDPIDVARNITGLNPETTLAILSFSKLLKEMASFSSPPRLPKGLRLRLSLVDCNKTPNTAEQIRTKLQLADLRRWLLVVLARGNDDGCHHPFGGPPPTPSPALSPEPTISPYPASPVPPSTIQGTSTSSSMSIPRFWNSSSPTSHLNPTVPPSYAPNGSPYSPSASPYTSPSSQFLQAESLVEIQFRFT
ncbi:unnamed protein product [Prunus armeniaca]